MEIGPVCEVGRIIGAPATVHVLRADDNELDAATVLETTAPGRKCSVSQSPTLWQVELIGAFRAKAADESLTTDWVVTSNASTARATTSNLPMTCSLLFPTGL